MKIYHNPRKVRQMEIQTKGIQEIRCIDNTIIFRFGTKKEAQESYFKQYDANMKEIGDLSFIFKDIKIE